MRGARYTAEFKAEAINQITARSHGVVEGPKTAEALLEYLKHKAYASMYVVKMPDESI